MKNNTKAVYLHFNKKTNEVIYVGAGEQTTRPYDFYQRSKEHKAYIEKNEVGVEIVKNNLSIEQAAKLEAKLIKRYSKTQPLFNVKRGGTGMNPMTEEQKAKMMKTREERGHNVSGAERLEKYPNMRRHYKRKRVLNVTQVKAIIREINKRLPVEGHANELDAEIAERYGVKPCTIWDIRNRKHRFAKYPQTLTRFKKGKGWAWRRLKKGETEFKNKKRVTRELTGMKK